MQAKSIPSLGSPALTHLHYAVNSFNSGNANRALAQVRAAYERTAFGREGVEDELTKQVWTQANGRNLCANCLQLARIEIPNESLGAWGDRIIVHMKESLQTARPSWTSELEQSVGCSGGKLPKSVPPTLVDNQRELAGEGRIAVSTIHGVKGETHDMTVIICPEPATEQDCPSRLWWPATGENGERKRVAYVALTRSSGDVVLCISPTTLENLLSPASRVRCAMLVHDHCGST